MITSASGWRKVFAASGNEQDTSTEIGKENTVLAALAAETFAQYILSKKGAPTVALGMDTRPTGRQICKTMLRVLIAKKISVSYTGIIASPEIMAYARTLDGFVYVSASHNPIGHNGIKFGLNDGGVLSASENALLAAEFQKKCEKDDAEEHAEKLIQNCPEADFDWICAESASEKRTAADIYRNFAKEIISGTDTIQKQNSVFARIRQELLKKPLSVVADMNGSARTLSIDADFFNECGFTLHTINGAPGEIAHEIIPEPENLVWCKNELEKRRKQGDETCILGYMPDCDGDRGNIVYWDEKSKSAKVLKAQEVFALSVLSEVAFSAYQEQFSEKKGLVSKAEEFLNSKSKKIAVAVNGPTSMRIDEIVFAFGGEVFRSEVGEANVVHLAREKRAEGYTVRILGEGSNGGNITHPSSVRDPICTIFALIKLLVLKDGTDGERNIKGLFHLWCDASGQSGRYKDEFTLQDIIETLPSYTTTGVSESRAILKIKTDDHSLLKSRFQRIFEKQWEKHKGEFKKMYGFESYTAVRTNGTKEVSDISDYSESKKGGLKIIFKDGDGFPKAFIWMRGSGTEPVFRVMCDVKGNNPKEEKQLLEWETRMLLKADEMQ